MIMQFTVADDAQQPSKTHPKEKKSKVNEEYSKSSIPPVSSNTLHNNPQSNLYGVRSLPPPCPMCQKRVGLDEVRECSGTQIFWTCILMCSLPVICWLPYCLSRCDDKRLQCANCKHLYDYYQAPMCPYI